MIQVRYFMVALCAGAILLTQCVLGTAQVSLQRKGTATQLIVDGRPHLMLAGELHNSSASGVEYVRQMWAHQLWLNGDETGANHWARIPPFSRNTCLGVVRPMILRVTLFRYD